MITIPAVIVGDCLDYEFTPPADAIAIRFDGGTNTFTVYQPGDELPPEPASEAG